MAMIRWLVVLVIFTALTGLAYMGSAQGWGLPGVLDKPVSVRQESATGSSHRHGYTFIYFGSRRHSGGGFHGGK